MRKLIFIMLLNSTFAIGQNRLFSEVNIAINQKAGEFGVDHTGFGFGLSKYFTDNKHLNFFYGLEYNFTQQHLENLSPIPQHSGIHTSLKNVFIDFHNISVPVGYSFQFFKKKKSLALEIGTYSEMLMYSSLRATKLENGYKLNNGELNYFENETNIKPKNQFIRINSGILIAVKTSINTTNYRISLKPEYRFSMRNLYKKNDYLENSYLKLSLSFSFL